MPAFGACCTSCGAPKAKVDNRWIRDGLRPPRRQPRDLIDVGGKILEDCAKDDFFGNSDARQPRTKDFLNKILAH
jgi:hypothetical protein